MGPRLRKTNMKLTIILFLLTIIPVLALIYGPRLACKTAFGRRLLLPRVTVDYVGGSFGLQEPSLLRKILITFIIPLDGVVKAIYGTATGKNLVWLYEPYNQPVEMFSPLAWDGRDATEDEKRLYLDNRVMAMSAVIALLNYRSLCFTTVTEIPQSQVGTTPYCVYKLVLF